MRMPDGGDHCPFGRRETTTPLPPAPDQWKPARRTVKTATPRALRKICCGGDEFAHDC